MTIYLDMDGTCANLYGVENWLEYLLNGDTYPYRKAKLMFSEAQIKWLQMWIERGNDVAVISWLCKGGNRRYNKAVRAAKIRWLKKYLPLSYAKIHIVEYGTPKSRFNCRNNILIDDEERNLVDWMKNGGYAALSPMDFQKLVEEWDK